MVHLVLLGVAQDAGVPQIGCSCANCAAVWSGNMQQQYAVSAALVDPDSGQYWLVDCSPDIKQQYHMLQEWLGSQGFQHCKLAGVLLTHLHMGHYVGLLQFGTEAMDCKGLQLFGTESVCTFLRANQPWAHYLQAGNFTLKPLEHQQEVRLSQGLRVTPCLVPHRTEFSDAVGFFIQGPTKRMFYLPDIDSWDKWAAAGTDVQQVASAVDIAFVDACFYDATELPGRDMSKIPHPWVIDTMQRLGGRATAAAAKGHPEAAAAAEAATANAPPAAAAAATVDSSTRVVLIHLNHTNPLWQQGSLQRSAVLAAGLSIGQQGAVYGL